MPPAHALATEFELQVRRLKLTPDTYASSPELRIWCDLNKDRIYVPEWLLQEWRMKVESTNSGIV